MQLSPIGLAIEEIDTPALVLDLDAFDANVATMAGHLASRGVQWRPHAKAFKCPAIAQWLRKAGAIGVTVAKVSEAEVMADGGIDDILIAHLVVGRSKTDRLAALQRRADVKATVDHPDQVGPLGVAASRIGVEIGLLVDVDLGMKRTGVGSSTEAVTLAQRVAETPGLRFDGLMGYEGHTLAIPDPDSKRAAIGAAIDRLNEARSAVEGAGLPCRIVSAGGTGSYQFTADLAGPTELQAGGGIFACRYYTHHCNVKGHTPALSVLASVVSRPSPDRAILDAGRKAVSDFRIDPALADWPDAEFIGLAAEHAILRVSGSTAGALKIGRHVRVTPGYSDFTFVLHDRLVAARKGVVEAVFPLLGRGKLQ